MEVFLIFVVIMHWYNPIAWWCKREFENVCESSCDERVLQGQEKGIRADYANLILRYTTNQREEIFGTNLSKGAREVEKRMNRILNRTKKFPKVVGAMLAVVLTALNSMTVFAYKDVKIVRGDDFEEVFLLEGDIALIPEGDELVWKNPEYVENYVYHYDVQFVDVEGNVYEVHEDVEPCFECEHDFVTGTTQKHIKNNDGSCVVYFYDSIYCILCGYLTDVVHVATLEFVVCPH